MMFLKALLARMVGRRQAPAPRAPIERVEELVERLKANASPCVRLTHGGSGPSQLGGQPDFGGAWPRFRGRPMSFLAQLNLHDVRAAGGPDWLPERGLLLFFYDFDHGAWGFSPDDAGSFEVIHVDVAVAAALPAELDADDLFPRCPLRFGAGLSYPDVERLGDAVRRLPEPVYEALETALEALAPGDPVHQIGGYPVPVQSDSMEQECQSVTSGVYLRRPTDAEDRKAKLMKSEVADWRLLLQLDTDDQAGMMFGDSGRLYFWIRHQDARAGDFSKAWVILQCH